MKIIDETEASNNPRLRIIVLIVSYNEKVKQKKKIYISSLKAQFDNSLGSMLVYLLAEG